MTSLNIEARASKVWFDNEDLSLPGLLMGNRDITNYQNIV